MTSERRVFTRKARQLLCNALLDLPYMQSQDRRDHLVRQLTPEFPGMRSVKRSDDPHVDLMEIVSAAYEYPGALRAILEIVSFLFGPEAQLHPIRGIVDLIDPDSLLTKEERQTLLDLLGSADPAAVAAAYHYGTGDTLHDLGLSARDVAAVVAQAESYPGRPDRLPALFEFVDHLAHRSPQSTRAALHRLMDHASLRIGFPDHSAVDRLCLATDNRLAATSRYYLVAELRPDRLREDRFFLAAWRQREDEPEEALYLSDQSVHPNEAITKTYELMRQLAFSVEGAAEEQVLELILPRSLVTHPIDQWQVDEVLPAAIGTNYPLVLRSFDRLDDPSLHGPWARNWRWVKQHDRTAGPEALREVDSHELAAVQALRGALLRDGPPAIVLMLTALPDSDSLRVDAYTAGLRGGAPIMVWSRDDVAGEELAGSVRAACREGLLSLREHIFRLRLGALEPSEASSASLHTTIVFDDYDRIPERFRGRARLRSPHTEEA